VAQTLSQIRRRLDRHGLRPRKRFGQNFLHDAGQLQRIVDAASPAPGERVFEVGPGTGALSEAALERGARVLAVEIDPDLQPLLQETFEPYGDRAELIIDDVLDGKHAVRSSIAARLRAEPFLLLANLPYHVASPLIMLLLREFPTMSRAVVMVQKEVADRLLAPPDAAAYGAMSVVGQTLARIEKIATLAPGCFWPSPGVDSAVVRLTPRAGARDALDPNRFADLVHATFAQRRKQIRHALARLELPTPDWLDPTRRPQTLSVEDFRRLYDWSREQAAPHAAADREAERRASRDGRPAFGGPSIEADSTDA